MNQNETLEIWLAGKRKLSPSPAFSQRVMASVEQSIESRTQVTKAFPHVSLPVSHNVPYWLTTATVIVCAVRTACFIQMLVEPTREYSVLVPEAISEVPNVK